MDYEKLITGSDARLADIQGQAQTIAGSDARFWLLLGRSVLGEPDIRERFVALDGLRGLAALTVLLYHLHNLLGLRWIFAHGYLAVDFFFLLSGFVIAHAYGDRLRRRGALLPFLRDRVIRLHPLLLLSIVPRGAMLVASMLAGEPAYRWPLATLIAGLVPFPALWVGIPRKFPLNPPSWSLFWELGVNLAFAIAAPRLGNRLLAVIVFVAVAGAIAVSLRYGGLVHNDFTDGFRALAGFAMGVMLFRVHRAKARGPERLDRLGALAAPLLLACLTLVPAAPRIASIYDPVAAYLLFPLLLLASARRRARFPALCTWLGGLSYPLYILHFPVLSLTLKPLNAMFGNPAVTALVQLPLSVVVALVAWRIYDEPIRAVLRRRLRARRPTPDTPDAPGRRA